MLAWTAAALLVAVEVISWTLPRGSPSDTTVRLWLYIAVGVPGCICAALYLAFRESRLPLAVTLAGVTTFGFYALATVYDLAQSVDLWPWIHVLGAVTMAALGWYLRGLGRYMAWTASLLFAALVYWWTRLPTLSGTQDLALIKTQVKAVQDWSAVNHPLLSAAWVLAALWLALSPSWLRSHGDDAAAQSL